MQKRLLPIVLLVSILAGLPACTPGRFARNAAPPSPAVIAPAVDFPAGLGPGDREGSLSSGGVKRTFSLHLPPVYDGRTPLPLVIVLHGGGGNAEGAARMTGFSREADREGFMVVYPNGSGRVSAERLLTWNAGNCCGYALDSKTDDVGFIRDLIDGLDGRLPLDLARVYATGISNGAMMSYRLACELSAKLAAIAPVAGALNLENCQPVEPVSVIIFHGTADQHVLFEGGKPLKQLDQAHPRIDKPVSYAVDFWVKADGCDPEPAREASGNVVRQSWTGGKNGSEVALYAIRGGGHAWPGGDPGWAGGDTPTREISATPIIWDFFKRHPRAGAPPLPASGPRAGRTTTHTPPLPALSAGNHEFSLQAGGKERRYLLHVPPSYDGRTPVPVVLMLHGGGGTADAARRETGWDAKADREGFLAVFPEGTPPFPNQPYSFLTNPPTWNDGSGRFLTGRLDIDDSGFMRALLDDLFKKTKVDQKRIYATGFSNGASMTFRLGVDLDDRLAAIAPVSGHLFIKDFQLDYPLPMLFVIGREDPLNPLAGGQVTTPGGKREQKAPVIDSVTAWVDAVGAAEQPHVFLEDNGVMGAVFGPGKQDAVVVYYTIEGAGHTWPGGLSLLPESMVGKRTDKLDATDVIWEFFKAHPRGD
jgi:polyhydroxybutyrate depolymerase